MNPVEPFRCIVADPPWQYTDKKAGMVKTGKGAASHYDVMRLADICGLASYRVGGFGLEIASYPIADSAHVWLWVTNAFLVGGEGVAVAESWGFTPKTIITWVKGRLSINRLVSHIGQGSYLRNSTEHVIFAVRGKCPPAVRNLPTAFIAPRGEHSAKPPLIHEWAELLSPGPRLELFARQRREGWVCWGNELDA